MLSECHRGFPSPDSGCHEGLAEMPHIDCSQGDEAPRPSPRNLSFCLSLSLSVSLSLWLSNIYVYIHTYTYLCLYICAFRYFMYSSRADIGSEKHHTCQAAPTHVARLRPISL